jgi:hypothetical protein
VLNDAADMPIRITVYDALGGAHVRFYGLIQTVEADVAGRGTATITAIDFLSKLQAQKPVLAPMVGATDGSILGGILDWMEWTDPAMRSLAVGDTIAQTYTRADGSRDALSLAQELMAAERGIVFASGAGAVTYIDRRSRWTAASAGSIDRTLTAFTVGTDGTQIVNSQTVIRTDMDDTPIGVPQLAQDATSIHKHGQIDGDDVRTPFLSNDATALSLAQGIVMRKKNGLLPVYEVPLSIVDSATQLQALGRELGDRVTLTIAPLNFAQFTGDFYVESIREQLQTRQSPRYGCTWRVSEVPSPAPFRFSISQFGGSDAFYW